MKKNTINILPGITGSEPMNKSKVGDFRRRSLLCMVALLSLILQAKAQHNSQQKEEQPSISQPFDILDRLRPVKFNRSGQALLAASAELFGFDLQQAKLAYPAMVSTETIWVPNGKSLPKTVAIERMDLKQLVPVLVAAIQQQQEQIAELKVRLSKIEDHSKISNAVEK